MTKKKKILIVIAPIIILIVVGSYFLLFKTEFYKRNEVISLMRADGDLFIESVTEIDRISEEYMDIEAIKKEAAYTLQPQNIVLQYITTTQENDLFPENWRTRTYEDLVKEFGKETVDGCYKYKDIEGLYASFFNGFASGHCVQIESDIFNEIFEKTPVTKVVISERKIFYNCYMRAKSTDNEMAGIFYSKLDEPEIPSGDEGVTIKTKHGWLYKSPWMKDYIEQIEGNFYYYNNEGHDPI